MKNILILGATGFVGRNLHENLREKYNVYAPNRHEVDVLDDLSVKRYLLNNSFDVVVNALDHRTNAADYLEKRLRMFYNLARCNDLYGRMFYFGSGAEYGKELPLDSVRETDFDRKTPNDTYGLCMSIMSKFAAASDNIYNFRLFGIFGKYEPWKTKFISNAVCKALVGYPITIRQNTTFDYLHIDDLCKIVEWAVENRLDFHDYNATSGMKYELAELAHMVNDVVNTEVPVLIAKEGIGKEYTSSNERLRKEMKDFHHEPIKESIAKLSDWYRKNIEIVDKYYLLYQ